MAIDYKPEVQPDGGVTISPRQFNLQHLAEGLSVAAVPVMAYIATRNRKLTTPEKYFLGAYAASAAVVDTWLLLRFMDARKRAKKA